MGLAPDPRLAREAIVQVYAARVIGWRGKFAVHTWIAVKPSGAPAYTVYEVIGWRKYRGLPPLVVHHRPADGRWFGADPEVLFEQRGAGVDAMIARIDAAAKSYPYANEYWMWPGPNSNTFTQHVIRNVPELALDLPPTAIGKDYLSRGMVAKAPSGTGIQVSLYGALGFLAGRREGIEINLLGLVFGIDPDDGVVKLPMIGRVRWSGQ